MPAPATPATDLNLLELFSSLQGEGPLCGLRQIFLRVPGCNLTCAYCDTDFKRQPFCRVETAPASGIWSEWGNPVPLTAILDQIDAWLEAFPGVHHSLSLTGGEPLHQADALTPWLAALRKKVPLHLETNGTLPDALSRVRDLFDHISADIKLTSVCGLPTPWEAHRRFLKVAGDRLLCVKAVVDETTSLAEIEQTAELLVEGRHSVDLVLQPRTTATGIRVPAPHLFALQAAAARIHPRVRVMPQVHRFLNLA